MYRIDNSTAATTIPAPGAVGPNPNGFFTDGVPGSVAATVVPADWLNATQEEIVNAITNAGLTPSKTNRTQLSQAIGGNGSLTTSGYMQLPGGLIKQWSSITSTTGKGDTITFPIPFPNACLGIRLNESAALGWGAGATPSFCTVMGTSSRTATNFKLYVTEVLPTTLVWGAGIAAQYEAIGY